MSKLLQYKTCKNEKNDMLKKINDQGKASK